MIIGPLHIIRNKMPLPSSMDVVKSMFPSAPTQPSSPSNQTFAENLSRVSGEGASRGSTYNPAQQGWLEKSEDNPELAERLISVMAELPTTIVYDVSDGNLRIANTGELASKEFESRFETYRQNHDQQVRALYESEKTKGTDPRDILRLMFNFENAAPDWFRIGSDPQYLSKKTFIPDEPIRTGIPNRKAVDVDALLDQLEILRADHESLNIRGAAI